jgi:hypothetical protein
MKNSECTVAANLQIVQGTRADYESLSQYHYRECRLGPYAAIFAIKGKFRTAEHLQTAGVIVYAMPTAGAQMRDIATGGIFAGLDRSSRLKLISKNIRTISRVIIEPRFRSLGLAVRLVKETMPLMNVLFIEALAVMGQVNPFFEKAGMARYDAPASVACVRLTEALGVVGINEQDLIDPPVVQKKLDELRTEDPSSLRYAGAGRGQRTDFIEFEIARFIKSYGRRRLMQPGIERTRFVLSKLTDRPVYYLWQNPDIKLRV